MWTNKEKHLSSLAAVGNDFLCDISVYKIFELSPNKIKPRFLGILTGSFILNVEDLFQLK